MNESEDRLEKWELVLELNSPLTEEQMDLITDVDFDHTNKIWFHTKHGKDVEFVKRIKGRWVRKESDVSRWYECSVCRGVPCRNQHGDEVRTQFCPWCGADMRGEEYETD